MEYYDNRFHPTETNDFDSANGSAIEKLKSHDRGYSFVYRMVERKNGTRKNTKIDIYASGEFGTNIRDAVTGSYHSEKVGSYAEHLFFKVGLSTGECRTKNGSSTLFFLSPEQYEKHLLTSVSQETKDDWSEKRASYIASCKKPVRKI